MEHNTGLLVLIFVIISLVIGALTRNILKGSQIPYTVALLVIGLMIGLTERSEVLGTDFHVASQTLDLVSNIDPHLILFVFLPILIFESAFGLEVHLFRRIFSQIVTLAVPGLIVCTALTAVFAKYVFPWDWSWPVCFMFGALISATDPVAVVALLKEVSSRKRLETLIEGESLLNDGTAIVFFTLFYGMVVATSDNAGISLGSVSWDFIWVVSGGLISGLICGWIAVFWIGKVFNDPMIEITVTIATAYVCFIVAEAFHVSGVVAVVTVAIILAGVGRTRISPEVAGFLHHFWEMMAFIANTIIFLLVGVLIAHRVQLDSTEAWINLGLLYIGIMIIRAFSVTIFTPILKRISIGFTKEKAIVLVWGGLRGAVSLALALAVAQDSNIPKEISDHILFLCAGIVFLTIFINGMAMLPVLRWVKLDRLPPAKEATVKKAQSKITHSLCDFVPQLEKNEFLQSANWDEIGHVINLSSTEETETEEKEEVSHEDLSIACRRRLLETERKHYWHQFEDGLLSKRATNKLVEAVEKALDGEPTISPRNSLHQYWQAPKLLNLFKKIPGLRNIAISSSFERLSIGYDIARGFIHAQDEILSYLPTLAPSKEAEADIQMEIMMNKRDTYARVEQLRATFPEVLCALETYAATRLLLNKERSVINQLVSAGVLDKPEAKRMIEDVETRMLKQQTKPTKMLPPDPEKLLRQISWLEGIAPETITKLAKCLEDKINTTGDVVMKSGLEGKALAILARGSVEIIIEEKNVEVVQDILGPGHVIGLMALLTGTYDTTVKANTPIEALWLPIEKLRPIMAQDHMLAENISKLMQQLNNPTSE